MSLNPDLIRTRCGEIEDSVSHLERLQVLSRDAFLADQDTLDLACYRRLVAIEAALALSGLSGLDVNAYPVAKPSQHPHRVFLREAEGRHVRKAEPSDPTSRMTWVFASSNSPSLKASWAQEGIGRLQAAQPPYLA